MLVKKLVTYPSEVWDDVKSYVMKKYHITTPEHNFSFAKFVYSKSFDYKKFIAGISERQAMYLFVLICRKLGVAFIPDSKGWQIACLEETAEDLMKFVSKITVDFEEVKQPQ